MQTRMKNRQTVRKITAAWERLKLSHGTLQKAATACNISYPRLSRILSGKVAPNSLDVRKLKLTSVELREIFKMWEAK